MIEHLHLVFSDPPGNVTDADLDAWYEAHFPEILAVDGWVSAIHHRAEPVLAAEQTGGFRYVNEYELDVEPALADANMAAMRAARAEGRAPRPLPKPDWYAGVRWGRCDLTAIGGRSTLGDLPRVPATAHLHMVFSDPPPGVTDTEYRSWSEAYDREVLEVDGWAAATRFRMVTGGNPEDIGGYRYLSRYELDVEPRQAIANLAAAGLPRRTPPPDWFAETRIGSWNFIALGRRTTLAAAPDGDDG